MIELKIKKSSTYLPTTSTLLCTLPTTISITLLVFPKQLLILHSTLCIYTLSNICLFLDTSPLFVGVLLLLIGELDPFPTDS